MQCLVTGGAGFIGYHLSRTLLRKGYEVSIIDNFSDYYSPEIKELNAAEIDTEGGIILRGSILDKHFLKKTFDKKFDVVFHLAAQPGVRFSTLNPTQSLKINIEGTSNILESSKRHKIAKIVLTSSSSVFGKVNYLPIDENHTKKPISFYGVSKLSTEHLAEVYRYHFPEINYSIVRPFTVIGPRQRPDMALNTFVNKAFQEEPITIFGDGTQTRDWTHVDNIVNAMIKTISVKKAKNEDFNIGAGTRTSVNAVIKLIEKITEKDLTINYQTFDKADARDTQADITKAQEILDYNPKKNLEIAIKEFIEDYLNRNLEKYLI